MKKISLKLDTPNKITDFMLAMNNFHTTDEYCLINNQGGLVDAKSTLSVVYAGVAFDKIFLVNRTNDGVFPPFIDQFKE